ncbi:MAG: RDD family protein [Treponema sp.]|nr:RDD family protein [Treponema sp.]
MPQKFSGFEPSLDALTPEGIKFVLFPAGLPVRTLAYAIDVIIQWIIDIILMILYMQFDFNPGIWLFLLVYFIVDWFYHVICELVFRGQSPGKRFLGIRVVKSDGSPVDPASSFLRNLLRFADTFFYLYHIAFISIAASSGFRRIGDWAGNTLVVYSSPVKNPIRHSLSRLLEKYEPVNPVIPLSNEEKQAILNFARRYPLLGEARANEIASIYVPFIKKDNDNISDSANASYLMGIARKLSGEM